MTRAWRCALILVPMLVAAGCARMPVRSDADAASLAVQAEREARLAATDRWTMTGRIAVNSGGDGGSGHVDWTQDGDDYRIRLSAPISRRSWVLEKSGSDVVLTGLEQGALRGTDAEALLQEATGWRLPVEALAAWARGARAPGAATIEFQPDGLPALIVQQGWQVEYREWDTADPASPRRVFAKNGDASVRLVVERWGTP